MTGLAVCNANIITVEHKALIAGTLERYGLSSVRLLIEDIPPDWRPVGKPAALVQDASGRHILRVPSMLGALDQGAFMGLLIAHGVPGASQVMRSPEAFLRMGVLSEIAPLVWGTAPGRTSEHRAAIDLGHPALPRTLFKYRAVTDHALRMLRDGEIFFAGPANLNDPAEFAALPVYHLGKPQEIYAKNVEMYALTHPSLTPAEVRELARLQTEAIVKNRHDRIRLAEYVRDMRRHAHGLGGVCSLSDLPSNPHLWDRYADGHRGFAVGFDTDALLNFLEASQRRGVHLLLERVHYVPGVPILNALKLRDCEVMTAMLFTKRLTWANEREYRLFWAEHCDKALTLPPEAISSVTLGTLIGDEDRERVKGAMSSRLGSVRLQRARLTTAGSVEIDGLTPH